MAILPTRVQDLLDFMDAHGASWNQNAAALGLSPAQGTLVNNGAGVARTKFNAHLAAQLAARAAAIDAHDAAAALRTAFAEALKTIKAYALTQPDPNAVYTLAQIPPPSQGSPLPPPGVPTDLKATLQNDGSVTLKWKGVNPRGGGGTVWTVERMLPGERGFSFCGSSGLRSFTDRTIPPGSSQVRYRIFGQRGKAIGRPCAAFTVQFGMGGSGAAQTIAPPLAGDGGARAAA